MSNLTVKLLGCMDNPYCILLVLGCNWNIFLCVAFENKNIIVMDFRVLLEEAVGAARPKHFYGQCARDPICTSR